MKLSRTSALSATVVITLATSVSATAQSTSHTVNLPAGISALDDPTAFGITQFDGNITDLTKITLTLESNFTGLYQVEELGSIAGNIEMQRDWEHLIQLSDGGTAGNVLLQNVDEWTGSGFFSPFDGGIDFTGSSGLTRNFGSTVTSEIEIDAADYAAFVGAGDAELFFDFNSFFEFTIIDGNQTLVIATADYTGSLTVSYEFVPAPGAAALAGFAGVASMRRRRSC